MRTGQRMKTNQRAAAPDEAATTEPVSLPQDFGFGLDLDAEALAAEEGVDTAPPAEPPLERFRPAFLLQTGQAPGPCMRSRFLAAAICWDFDALCGMLAYRVPPAARQLLAENCRPP